MRTGGDEAIVFDVQRFCVHDGPGLRTTIFFKGCVLRCRWCQNPESFRPNLELVFRADRCRLGRGCQEICPENALHPENPGAGNWLDRSSCSVCALCVSNCAQGALQVMGRRVAVADLVTEASRDLAFFESSGGGVTLSGGEPMLQADAVRTFVTECRGRGVRVGIQTCGAFRFEDIVPILDLLEFIHFDLKVMDRDRHLELTGRDNDVILKNAKQLLIHKAPVQFRVPVIPGHTDDPENLNMIADFLLRSGEGKVRLLEGNFMGPAKAASLGLETFPYEGVAARLMSQAHTVALARMQSRGLEVVW